MSALPIEDHGVIGDLETVALVGRDGCIDFMCFPEFDSPTIFASLLDEERGGHFHLAPELKEATRKQLYLPDTNVLITRFLSEQGVAEISDFMTIGGVTNGHDLVRRAKTVRGEVEFQMSCAPRFDYGRVNHRIEWGEKGRELFFVPESGGQPALRLWSECPMAVDGDRATARCTLRHGETAAFVLEDATGDRPGLGASSRDVAEAFKSTLTFWRDWIGRSKYNGRWREMVNRSALVLKLLTSRKHGSIVAAPTFGLPEELGGVRNWDYRYTWVRDASFTVYALIRLGYTDEARDFMGWIEARIAEREQGGGPEMPLQIMYGIDGRHDLFEQNLPHFRGYQGSLPVRIGNGAFNQLQLDIYGELMDSVYLFNKYGREISYDLWRHLVRLIDWVCENWERQDAGIWEIRSVPKPFLYSRLMCWVAIDRGIRLAFKRSFPAPVERWREVRDTIYRNIFDKFWSESLQAFVQAEGSEALDASALLMPLVKFIGPSDPRWVKTLSAIGDQLVEDSLVYLYRIDGKAVDGLGGEEGTFCLCTFWYVECLANAGDLEKARFIFEKMLGYANHVGLYAEELGPRGEHLGNFPQAFTHLALISAAYNLDRRLNAAGH